MYAQYRTVKLAETDATGIVYFTEVQKYAVEALEEFLHTKALSLAKMIEDDIFLLPIVHVAVDYLCPLFVGDLISIQMSVEKSGVSSFTLKYEIKKDESDFVAAIVKITHVSVDTHTRHAVPIPRSLIDILKVI